MENKFNLLGEEIIITPKMERMIRIQTVYRIAAERYIQALDKEYSSLFKCFEDFLGENGLEEMAIQFIRLIIELTSNVLERFNIELDSDAVTKIQKHCEKLMIFNVSDEFQNIYNALLDIKEQSRKIRELRKDTAPRFEGFGFGISGAIKGAIKAELANMGVNAFYLLANSIGNAKTQYQVKATMDKIFNDPNTKESIKEILYNDLISFYFVAKDIINDSLPFSERYYGYGLADSDKANELFTKITDVDAYIEKFKANINYLLQNSNGQYTQQMARQAYEGFYKELNASDIEQDIKEILKVFPFKYEYFKLYFTYIEHVDKDIEAYARLCGFDISELINAKNKGIVKKE